MKVSLVGYQTLVVHGVKGVFKNGESVEVDDSVGNELLAMKNESGGAVFVEGAAPEKAQVGKKVVSVGKKVVEQEKPAEQDEEVPAGEKVAL